MSHVELTLGESLRSARNELLQQKLDLLARMHGGGSLHADTVFAFWCGLQTETTLEPATSYLLFDLHRVFYFREPTGARVRIGSVIRYIVDGYPFQPFELLLEHLVDRPFDFCYSPDTLDILPLLWQSSTPGILTTLSLAAGEITHAPAHVHPEAVPVSRASDVRPPAGGLELRERRTDDSLRSNGPTDLEGLVSPAAAPVRDLTETANHASLRFGIARVMWSHGARNEYAGGKSLRARDAESVAMYEALERFHIAFQPPGEELIGGTYAELRDHALDPRTFFFGQFPSGTATWLREFSDEAPLNWTWTFDARRGTPALVPAQEIWFNTKRLLAEDPYVATCSNGCAIGGSIEEAAMFALFELIERDAFLTMWYLRRRCRRIDPDSVRHEPFQLLRRRWLAAYPDYEFYLYDIGTDIAVPTVAAVAVRHRNEGPRTFHAAATHLSAERACHAALKDLTGFTPEIPPGRLEQMRSLLNAKERVVGPTGHYELFCLDEAFESLDFMDFGPEASVDVHELNQRAWIPKSAQYDLRSTIFRLAEHLHPLGVSLYLKDISHPWLPSRGLRCVKAIAPGMFPLWFGSGAKRFAVTPRLRRLARDFLGRELSHPVDFNLGIHPFS